MSKNKLNRYGFDYELVKNVNFVGKYDMPLIKKEKIKEIKKIIPFDKRKKFKDDKTVVHFYLYDKAFKKILDTPKKYKDELKIYEAVISPDFSICYDMPLSRQIYSTYMNRLIGAYYQNNGIKVIPNVRWGDSRSYEFCFEGLEKEATYAIGSYGQIKKKENRYYFEKGLEEFFKKLNPEKVYVYGTMPDSIFKRFKSTTELICLEPYISKIHRGVI